MFIYFTESAIFFLHMCSYDWSIEWLIVYTIKFSLETLAGTHSNL